MKLAGLTTWRRKRSREIVIYGKPGCHLCDDARELVERLERRYPHSITEVDITTDPALFRRYDIRIPVIVIDGGDEIDAPITEETLSRALG